MNTNLVLLLCDSLLANNEVGPVGYYLYIKTYVDISRSNTKVVLLLYKRVLAYIEVIPIWYYFYIIVFWHIRK